MIHTVPATCPECGVTVVVTTTLTPHENGKGFGWRVDIRSPFLHQCALKKRNELENDLVCPILSEAAHRAADNAQKTSES